MAISMLHALVSPSPRTILWFVDSAFTVLMMEAVMLVPLATFGNALAGRRQLASRIGIGLGAAAAVVCLLVGGSWFSLVVALHVQGRIASLSGEPDLTKYSTGDWKEWMGIVKNRWMMQFAFFVVALLASNAAGGIRHWLAPETRGLLRAAGGTEHSLIDVIWLLLSCSVYFFLSVINDAFRLPCLHRAHEDEAVPVRAIVARVEREHRARAEAASSGTEAAEAGRAQAVAAGTAFASAVDSPERAQALLLSLAGSGGDPAVARLPLSRRLLMADAALGTMRGLSGEAKSEALARLTAAVAADARMTPAEFALLVLARSRLGFAQRPSEQAAIEQRASEFDMLLALVARAGEGDAARSMASGRKALGLAQAPEPPSPDFRSVSEALRRLRDLDALSRTRLVQAIAGAVFPMNEARVALLYAISVTLEVPLPAEVRAG